MDELSLVHWSPTVIGQNLRAVAAAPLVTEHRGFDRLERTNGAWLEVCVWGVANRREVVAEREA